MKKLFVWFFGMLMVFTSWGQATKVKATIDTSMIRIGEQTNLTLKTSFKSGLKVIFPTFKDSIVKGVEIVSVGKIDTVFSSEALQNESMSQDIRITAFDSGFYAIPPFRLVVGEDTMETNPLLLEVRTVEVDTTQAIRSIHGPLSVHYSFMDWIKDNYQWILLGISLVLIAFGIYIYLKKRKNKPIIEKQTPKITIPPDVEAIEKLKHIAERKLWQAGETKLYYTEITDVLRNYLEGRFRVSAVEKTTDELMATIRLKPISDEERENLRELFRLADLVKFAKEKPIDGENEQSMKTAVQFIHHTKETSKNQGE